MSASTRVHIENLKYSTLVATSTNSQFYGFQQLGYVRGSYTAWIGTYLPVVLVAFARNKGFYS